MNEIEPSIHFDKMNKVVSELLKGNSATQIAAITGINRKDVLECIMIQMFEIVPEKL